MPKIAVFAAFDAIDQGIENMTSLVMAACPRVLENLVHDPL